MGAKWTEEQRREHNWKKLTVRLRPIVISMLEELQELTGSSKGSLLTKLITRAHAEGEV